MIGPSGEHTPVPAGTMAAIIAAVQAYLDLEAGPPVRRLDLSLSAWKTEPWRVLRAWSPARGPSWSSRR